MKMTCIFDLQDTLISKSGKLLVNVKKLSKILNKYCESSSLYTINEPWTLNQLAANPDLAVVFKNIYLVNTKIIQDAVWLQQPVSSKTLVIGDGKESELAFAKILKIPSLDVNKVTTDLTEALEDRLMELCNGY